MRVVLTADKGVCMVVLDREEYIKKAEELLNQDSHKIIPADPTTKEKNKLITLLKNIKAEGGINKDTYKRLYPTGAGTPKFYGLPKIHKAGIPLRPVVSSRGAVSYETARELARILKPLVGKSAYSVQNTRDFVQQLKNIKLQFSMDASHSVWFYVDFVIFSKTELKFVGRQAFTSIKHGFFQVWGKC